MALPLWSPDLMWRIMNTNTATRIMAMKAAYIILKILFPMMFSVFVGVNIGIFSYFVTIGYFGS